MLIFQSADIKRSISADLPPTYRRRTADLPLTSPPPKGGVPWGNSPMGAVGITPRALKKMARDQWGIATAFRVGLIAGEIGVRIANPYRGKLAALYRDGLRRGRNRYRAKCLPARPSTEGR